MTIHHVIPDHAFGGGAVAAARLIRALAEGVEEPQSAVLPANSDADTRALFADLPHVVGTYPGRGPLISLARCILALARRGDVVHAHGTRAAMGAMLANALRPGLRTVYTVHGFHGLAQRGRFGVRARMEHVLARRVHATAFVSEADAALARGEGLRYRGPAAVIENGLSVPEPESGPGTGPRDIDLLFVGRLVHQKWPEAFVEAAARLPGAPKVVMVGAGEKAAEVDALAARLGIADFTRHDGLPPDRTLAMMARARVLAMTSRWEGLPTVAIEAAQSGALVAGFSIPPLAGILEETAERTLTPPDPAALAARLSALLGDEAARRGMAEALAARTRARFSPARMAERYAELYGQARAG